MMQCLTAIMDHYDLYSIITISSNLLNIYTLIKLVILQLLSHRGHSSIFFFSNFHWRCDKRVDLKFWSCRPKLPRFRALSAPRGIAPLQPRPNSQFVRGPAHRDQYQALKPAVILPTACRDPTQLGLNSPDGTLACPGLHGDGGKNKLTKLQQNCCFDNTRHFFIGKNNNTYSLCSSGFGWLLIIISFQTSMWA